MNKNNTKNNTKNNKNNNTMDKKERKSMRKSELIELVKQQAAEIAAQNKAHEREIKILLDTLDKLKGEPERQHTPERRRTRGGAAEAETGDKPGKPHLEALKDGVLKLFTTMTLLREVPGIGEFAKERGIMNLDGIDDATFTVLIRQHFNRELADAYAARKMNLRVYRALVHYFDDYVDEKPLEVAEEFQAELEQLRADSAAREAERKLLKPTEGPFKLPGRAALEGFINNNVVDIVNDSARYARLGIGFPKGFILEGKPGCGKTFAVERLAEHLKWHVVRIDSGTIGSKFVHETPKLIEAKFQEAAEKAPSIVIIDEMEAFTRNRGSMKDDPVGRVEEVDSFLKCLQTATERHILVAGMTNHISSIDPAILRTGRLGAHIKVDMPSAQEVEDVLAVALEKRPHAEFDLHPHAERLLDRPLSDVAHAVDEAAMCAARARHESIQEEDLARAIDNLVHSHPVKKPRDIFAEGFEQEEEKRRLERRLKNLHERIKRRAATFKSTAKISSIREMAKLNRITNLEKMDEATFIVHLRHIFSPKMAEAYAERKMNEIVYHDIILYFDNHMDIKPLELTDEMKAEVQAERERIEAAKKAKKAERMKLKPTDGPFRLRGREELEQFLNEQVVDIVNRHADYSRFGVHFPKGFILEGKPGCGKTFAVERLAEHLKWHVVRIDSGSIGSSFVHATPKKIQEKFQEAAEKAPSIVIIDEMEAFTRNRANLPGHNTHSAEEVDSFLQCLQTAAERHILVAGMTNHIETIDPAILRTGRLGAHIKVDMPSLQEVQDVLAYALEKLPHAEFDLRPHAERLLDHPLSDVTHAVDEAGMNAARAGHERIEEEDLAGAIDALLRRQSAEKPEERRFGFAE